MEYKLKRISTAGISEAIAKTELYRSLNEPEEAESICRDILAVVNDFTLGRTLQAQNAAAGRGLAAAALADEAERLSASDREVDAVDGFDLAGDAAADNTLGDRKVHAQAAYGQ